MISDIKVLKKRLEKIFICCVNINFTSEIRIPFTIHKVVMREDTGVDSGLVTVRTLR